MTLHIFTVLWYQKSQPGSSPVLSVTVFAVFLSLETDHHFLVGLPLPYQRVDMPATAQSEWLGKRVCQHPWKRPCFVCQGRAWMPRELCNGWWRHAPNLIHGLVLLLTPLADMHAPLGSSLIMVPVVCCGGAAGMGAPAHSFDTASFQAPPGIKWAEPVGLSAPVYPRLWAGLTETEGFCVCFWYVAIYRTCLFLFQPQCSCTQLAGTRDSFHVKSVPFGDLKCIPATVIPGEGMSQCVRLILTCFQN